ncbi:MAG: prephenate dehydratase [Acidobacteria bacterium]|nr:prephenate dehydratase [Acidobacteriota bacterium]
MDLNETRRQIDRIDFEIVKLLNMRMELALRARKLKPSVQDPAREMDVLSAARKHSQSVVRPEFSEKLFAGIIDESRQLQAQDLTLVGFQGEHGANSELAVRSLDPSWVPIPCVEFVDVFECVRKGQLDGGVVPVENSIEGGVTQVNDLLVEVDVRITGEIRVPIHHCLLALPDSDYRDIKVVYSHPQALAQCREFLARNKLEPRPFYDTAGSAMMLSRERPKAAAVIANRLCAELYDLEILKENIEDHESNSTRFVVLRGGEGVEQDGNKCSIIFRTAHRSGALFSVLKIFSDAGINLTRIESRPIRQDPGNYAFLLDFQGSSSDVRVRRALEAARGETAWFKFLGCYTEAAS